jgi:TonB-dependent SusC/RagA subfamily outer membrane receptor
MLSKKILLPTIFFLSFLATFLFGQNRDSVFQNKWAEIDTLIISRNLTTTALTKVNALYQEAKKENNPVQLIKCLIYRLSLEGKINETDPNRNVNTIETEINTTKDITAKSILYALLAKQYQIYFNNHRWQFYNRSKTIGYKKTDIATWSTDDFRQVITKNYQQSIQAETTLQKVKLTAFDAIIIKGNARKLRPTLYDLLAHEALDYFKTGEAYITKPTYAFVIDKQKALAKTDDFLTDNFTSKDTDSHLLLSLQLFQRLMNFHKKDAEPDALIDVNIERITWVHQQAVFENKEQLYTEALTEITSTFQNNANSDDALYLLARKEADQAQTYAPFGDTTHRFDYAKALQMSEKGLLKYKVENEGTAHLKNLITEIKKKNIQLQTEKVNIPGKPFRTLVTYKNVDTLYCKIINISTNDSIRNKQSEPGIWKYATQLTATSNFSQTLPSTNDYQQHAVEIKMDALPVGEYALITSSGKEFKTDSDKMALQFFYVSNLSYIQNNNDYFVLNRETGNPIDSAKVTVLKKTYNAQRKSHTEKMAPKYTDKNGYINININSTNLNKSSFELIIENKNDKLHLHESEYMPYQYNATENDTNYEQQNARTFYFTDRSIYRPGQKVFFKGIAVTSDKLTRQSKLYLLKDSLLIYLIDANSKNIDSVHCKQNEFGSFTNSFILPQNVLTGRFTIQAKSIANGEASFSVEEYKRPQFYVTFEKVKESYQLNDSITVTGFAKAFAGNTIDGAHVKFNVKRTARFIYSWLFIRGIQPFNNNAEITHGEMTTDATGKFSFTFKALPDLTIDKKTNPLFDFSIEAEVTDINGETRKANTTINTGYQSLLLQIEAPAIAECDSVKKEISINTKNMSGEKEDAAVQIKIYSLQSPQRLIRQRLWPKPDQFIMSKADYIQHFPNDDYNDETNYQNWPVSEFLLDRTIHTDSINQLLPDDLKLKPGYYRMEATTYDKHKQLVKDVKYIQLFNTIQAPAVTYNFSSTSKKIVEPGQKAIFLTGSSADEIHVIRQTIKPNSQTKKNYDYLERGKGLQPLTYTPEESDRGDVFIQDIFVKNNRVYTNTYNIIVPWTNKELQVNYKTFRDKTEPGSKEKWTVTVNGSKGESAAAELVSTLYDASLDQFIQHKWEVPYIWPTSNYYNSWNYFTDFSPANSYGNRNHFNTYNNYYKIYDQLAKDAYSLANSSESKKEETNYNKSFSQGAGSLNEVVVVGYGMQRKTNITGSVSQVLQGSLPGVNAIDGQPGTNTLINIRGTSGPTGANPLIVVDGIPMENMDLNSINPEDILSIKVLKDASSIAVYGIKGANGVILVTTKKQQQQSIQIRKNFNETAFFFPQLHADSLGNYSFTFTMPEAVTQWKWMSFAHTKDLAMGTNSALITTQKTLMVQPNAPRFMREGDHMEFVAKVANLSNKELTGQATLELLDATTNTPVDGWFQNIFPVQFFTVAANQSSSVKFPIQIPFGFNKPLTYRVSAKTAEYSDGEENILPVLTNRMLVTESLPLLIHSDTTQHFVFEKLAHHSSETLTNESLTVEYTSNPVWYAVQALPYLIEYPYECAEQTFNRFYANALASSLVNKHPRIKAVFEQWEKDTTSLKSNLQKNEELKQVLLQETPWVLQAENEELQKKNIALLFDIVKMSTGMDAAIEKLKQMQLANGSFCWFKGGYEDRYITNYILTGIGKLKKAGMLTTETNNKLNDIISKATQYLDDQLNEDYQRLIRNKIELSKENLSSTQIQYLYMKSFFTTDTLIKNTVYQYYYNQAKQYWIKQNLYNQAMLGLVFFRGNDQSLTLKNIIPSITENAIISPDKGMYWKDTYTSFWYLSPIEYQSLMISLFNEVNEQQKDPSLTKEIGDMQTWLLLNKQTNNWRTTVATADACYALLTGTDLLNVANKFTIQLGTTTLNNNTQKVEEGTGYFKKRLEARLIKPEMGNITITTQSIPTPLNPPSVSFGNIYWQYFEDLDKITEASSPLTLHKNLFIEKNSDKGKILTPLNEGDELKVGDKIIVRLELKSDRDMEYLHLKDMRAACMEPVNVISGYKWQDGLGYYEATQDASTNFFIGNLKKGVYVFEYPLYTTHTGTFSVGIATIQCMYAPEFSSHSEGIKVRVIAQP